MTTTITLALDAMGGDDGPTMVLPGSEIALERRSGLNFLIYGEAPVVEPLLAEYSRIRAASTFIHCDVSVQMDDKPSQALGADGRQAQPGAASRPLEVEHVALHSGCARW